MCDGQSDAQRVMGLARGAEDCAINGRGVVSCDWSSQRAMRVAVRW